MIKYLYTFFLVFLFTLMARANMAKPYIEGMEHTAVYGSQHCKVRHENIVIDIRESKAEHILYGIFKVQYHIESETDQDLPLLFLAKGLYSTKRIIVNNKSVEPDTINPETVSRYPFIHKGNQYNPYYITYSKGNDIPADLKDLVYFQAALKKGDNVIYIEYSGDFTFRTYGFLKNYQVNYSLYPSQYWKSFGDINLELHLNGLAELTHSNLGKPLQSNQILQWTLRSTTEDIALIINHKTSWFAKLLLFIQPIGIALLALLLMVVLHIRLLRTSRYHKLVFWSGTLLSTAVFYTVFFCSYSWIDLVLGSHSRQGYIFMFIFTLPIFAIVYGLILFIWNKHVKAR